MALGAWSSKRAMVWGDWTGGRGPHTCGQNIGYRGNFTWSQLELLIDLHYRQEFYVHFLGRTHMESEGIILFVTNRNPEMQIWNLIFLSLFIWNESFACSNIYSIYSILQATKLLFICTICHESYLCSHASYLFTYLVYLTICIYLGFFSSCSSIIAFSQIT